jgi:nucleoside diphosphate kinase
MALEYRLAVGAVACVGLGSAFYWLTGPVFTEPVAPLRNRAFVFVKPHALTDATTGLVRDELRARGVTILNEGDITSEKIDEQKLIDQHYYAIASKATILKPEEMNVPADKFEKKFGKKWEDALKEKKVYNALDACKQLGIDGNEMNKIWAAAKKADKLVKFGGGFYCGEVNYKGKTLYVFNGFFMEMRGAFTQPGKKIHYYDVEWDPKKLSWADFRGKVLGPTDPKDAPKESLRGKVLSEWKKLGLTSEPNVGDNAVHASASPFEGLAERMNWMGVKCAQDSYCQALVKAGIHERLIDEWTKDPQVVVDSTNKKKSLFDSLEDQDAKECLETAKSISKFSKVHF